MFDHMYFQASDVFPGPESHQRSDLTPTCTYKLEQANYKKLRSKDACVHGRCMQIHDLIVTSVSSPQGGDIDRETLSISSCEQGEKYISLACSYIMFSTVMLTPLYISSSNDPLRQLAPGRSCTAWKDRDT